MTDPIEREVRRTWGNVDPSPEIREGVLDALHAPRPEGNVRERRMLALAVVFLLFAVGVGLWLKLSGELSPGGTGAVVASAETEDGQWRVDIEEIRVRGGKLSIRGRVRPTADDLALGSDDPLVRYVAGPFDVGPGGFHPFEPGPDGAFELSGLPAPTGGRISRLDLDFTVLRMDLGAVRLEVPGPDSETREAGGWPVRVEAGADGGTLKVSFPITEGGDPRFVGPPAGWFLRATDVRDRAGARLVFARSSAVLAAEYRKEEGPIAWPVKISLPALEPLSSTPVRVSFRDLEVTEATEVGEWTDFGPEVEGLSLRARVRRRVEEGTRLPVTVEVRYDPARLSPGVRRLGETFDYFVALELTPATGGPVVRVDPYDPTGGFRDPAAPEPTPLNGPPVAPRTVELTLATVGAKLPLGAYEGRIVYSCPDLLKRWDGSVSKEHLAAPGYWRGTVRSAPFSLEIVPEPPRTQTVLLPKKLTMVKGLRLVFDEADAEPVELPARNGYHLGVLLYHGDGSGFPYGVQGLPRPGGPNAIASWPGHEGPLHETVTIVVYHSFDPGGHMDFPGPGDGGFEVLWRRTFRVDLTAEEVNALR